MKVYRGLLAGVFLIISCGSQTDKNEHVKNSRSKIVDELAEFTDSGFTDGFDYPVGNPDGKGKYVSKVNGKTYDSWYISTKFAEEYRLGIHTGIDINGIGGGNTDLGQPVYSIASGSVEEAVNAGAPWGNVVMIKHKYLENAQIKHCYSLYAHLENLKVKKGDFVGKRALLGEIGTGGGAYPAHLHVEIRKERMKDYELTYWPSSNSKTVKWVKENYEDPESFIKEHRTITDPKSERRLLLAIKHQYKMYYFENGLLKNQYEIALSQNPIGHKEKEGDLKLPEGEYYIYDKQQGPFSGDYSEFLGPCVLRISYPNKYDAIEGYKKKLISKMERDKIIEAHRHGIRPPSNTKLGGKIVIHGWNGEWVADGSQNLTWGCICMHNSDVVNFYNLIPLKTKILIIP
jgi:murein DD-endopeptidase MepM/ murein hydrolase activator NlpD